MHQSLLNHMDEGTLILCTNNRLSIFLIEQYAALQTKTSYPSPKIYSFNQYLQIYHQKTLNTTLLSPLQTQAIWQNIIKNSNEEDMHNWATCAQLCTQAHEIIKMWEIHLEKDTYDHTYETKLFMDWAEKFDQTCQTQDLNTHACVLKHLIENIESQQGIHTIYWVGFEELSPLQKRLHDTFNKQKKSIIYEPTHIQDASSNLYCALDERDEIHAMVEWAVKKHKRGQTIACIIPDLAKQREMIIDTFSKHNSAFEYPLINIAAPPPINTYPIIKDALTLLEINKENICIASLKKVLNSPYLTPSTEAFIFSTELSEEIEGLGLSHIPRSGVIQIIQKLDIKNDIEQEMQNQWLNLFKTKKQYLQSYTQWADQWLYFLEKHPWPSSQGISSENFQVIQAFLKIIDQVKSLDLVSQPTKEKYALLALNHLCLHTSFQPEGHDAPIQILGILEAATISFNHAWICGFSSSIWPKLQSPSPLIPLSIQKKHGTPHGSIEREISYSQKLFERLKKCAATVVWSFSKSHNGAETSPAHCVSHFPRLAAMTNNISQVKDNNNSLESIHDIMGPQFEDQRALGGTQMLESFIHCPFKAFAKYRLNTKSLAIMSAGTRNYQRGLMIHKGLEVFWRETKDQARLKAIQPNKLKNDVAAIIEKASQIIYPKTLYAPYQHLIHIEKKRATEMMLQWLEYERNRPPFEVSAIEKEMHISLDNTPITIKIDRVDTCAHQKAMVIDYKTGESNPKLWFSTPIQSPQMPLYASFLTPLVDALAFAEIKSKSIRFKGYQNNESTLHHDLKTLQTIQSITWSETIAQWKTQLVSSMQLFKSGYAEAKPINKDLDCRYCRLHFLCRINQC